ncbi:PREDICTED: ras-related protein Rab-21-like [Nicrophorus vespilloides]|uniref:Ras-related protein Rab-21 n=1 Tax=Nicrophorus vespilloides TaxID=110193 RepID=A0ABM1N031_NICVS|nr:PREDICTED: ras-related protein Rab-21-like [Nicrophorus vespilloides]
MATTVHNFKVVLLGKGCVGKTSIVLRYAEDKFNNDHLSTIQASFLNKKLNIDGKRVNLAIWDTAGQEQFHALGPLYYRSSNGAIIVYDITDEDSLVKVKSWVKELRKMLGSDVSLVIVGNKTDLEKDRHVNLEEAETYASKVGALHWQTSAKRNEGIEEMFLTLIDKMLQREREIEDLQVTRQGSNHRKNVVVVDDEQVENQTKSCCGSNT